MKSPIENRTIITKLGVSVSVSDELDSITISKSSSVMIYPTSATGNIVLCTELFSSK